MKKVLVVDDELSIVTLLQYNLEQAGYSVITALDGEEGEAKVLIENPDFIILDLMLPKIDGIELCKRLRRKRVTTPILMLTAKDEEVDKVLGLELGADDYMTKPFSPREVIARVRAIFRRTELQVPSEDVNAIESNDHFIGELIVKPEQREAYFRGELLELTPKEFELLHYLLMNKGVVLTREHLLRAIWKYEFVGDTRMVDVHISHLREKIEDDSKKPLYIKTVRGHGYKMEEPKNR